MTTFRAAYFLSFDKQAEVLLTSEDHAHLPDAELIKIAEWAWLESGASLDDMDGEIVIGDWIGRD